MSYRKRSLINITIGTVVLILLTWLIAVFKLDIQLQQSFFNNHDWYLAQKQPWAWLYKYGTLPGIALAVISMIVFVTSYVYYRWIAWRKYTLFILLSLLIGPGIIINSIFKDHWGRPRPRQIQEFGGKWNYHELWQPGIAGKGKSFPCGHSSMGFYLVTLYYLFRRRNKWVGNSALAVAIIYGTMIGIARMIQGGHFASDVVWSAGFTFLTAEILYYWILKIPLYDEGVIPTPERNVLAYSKRRLVFIIIASLFLLAILVFAFLVSKPFNKEFDHSLPPNIHFSILKLSVENNIGDITLHLQKTTPDISIITTATGFGFPKRTLTSDFNYHLQGDTLHLSYRYFVKGYFFEFDSQTAIKLNARIPSDLLITTNDGDIVINNSDSSESNVKLTLTAPKGIIKKNGF
jgi:lipid A 4'-phosphatase